MVSLQESALMHYFIVIVVTPIRGRHSRPLVQIFDLAQALARMPFLTQPSQPSTADTALFIPF